MVDLDLRFMVDIWWVNIWSPDHPARCQTTKNALGSPIFDPFFRCYVGMIPFAGCQSPIGYT